MKTRMRDDYTPPPAWSNAAVKLVNRLHKTVKIKTLRLTPDQAHDLADYTGRNDMLLGYPVEIKDP